MRTTTNSGVCLNSVCRYFNLNCISRRFKLSKIVTFLLCISILFVSSLSIFPAPALADATTSVSIIKYDARGNILSQATKDYQWMEANLPVYGDGVTHYYCEGPYYSATDFNTLWDTIENGTNIDSRDYGAAKGTDVKDLCNLVGGASSGDVIKITASDGFNMTFDYENVYTPSPAQGKIVICWYNASFGGDVPAYDTGMRLLFFAETTNPNGKHVFGLWDMHQTMPASRWYYNYNNNKPFPSSSGLSVQNVSTIEIHQPNLVSCDASGNQKESFTPGDTVYVKGVSLAKNTSYKLWIQNEPVLFAKLDSLDRPDGSYGLNTASDPSGTQESVSTDANGDFSPLAIWAIPSSAIPQKFDIVADNQATGTIGTYDTNDAIDSPGQQGFTVVSEIISLTVTDDNNNGVNFGTVSPGIINQPADGQPAQGAVTLTIGKETNVKIDIKVKGTDFTGSGTIPVGNVKYNDSNALASAKTLTTDYVTWYSVSPPLSEDVVRQVYYWLSMPNSQVAGSYMSTFYYQAVKSP